MNNYFIYTVIFLFFIGCQENENPVVSSQNLQIYKADIDTVRYIIPITDNRYCAIVVEAPVIYQSIHSLNYWLDRMEPEEWNANGDSGLIFSANISAYGGKKETILEIEIPINWNDLKMIRSFINKRGLQEVEGSPTYPRWRIPLTSGKYCMIAINTPVTFSKLSAISWGFMPNWTPMYLKTGTIYTYDYIGLPDKKATLTIEHPVTIEDKVRISNWLYENDWSKIPPQFRREPLM